MDEDKEKLIRLLIRASNELDAFCDARPDLRGDAGKLVKEIEEELTKYPEINESRNNVQ